MNMKKIFPIVPLVAVLLISMVYIYSWTETAPTNGLQTIIYSHELRPYVYRILAPALSRFLVESLSLRMDLSVWIVQTGFALGFYLSSLSILNLYLTDRNKSALIAFIPSILVYALIIPYGKMYDMGTAFLFTLCLSLLARRKFILFCIAYFVACWNRETMFLITLFFAVYFLRKMDLSKFIIMLIYQGIVFLGTKILINMAFAGTPGDAFLFRPLENIYLFIESPVMAMITTSMIGALLFFVFRGWKQKPAFLRSIIIILLPAQMILHFFLGYTFEFRVYIEIFPVLIFLSFPWRKGLHYASNTQQNTFRTPRTNTGPSGEIY